MQKTFTIKYDKKVCHGIKFELGNGKYHSLNFLLKKQANRILLEKGSLFLEKITRAQTVDSIFQFKRKVKEQFINKDAIWFEYDRTFDIFDSSFYLTRISGYTGFSDNVSASTNRINKSGISNNLINFYIGEPQKNIYHLDNISINKDDKSTRLEEREKRIDYSITYIDINEMELLKNKDNNKYKTNISECVPASNNSKCSYINEYTKELQNKTPDVLHDEMLSLLRSNIEAFRDYVDKTIKIQIPNIYLNDTAQLNSKDKELSSIADFYLLEGLTPDIQINESKHVKAGYNKGVNISNTWYLIDIRDKKLNDISELVAVTSSSSEVSNTFSDIFLGKWDSEFNFQTEDISVNKKDNRSDVYSGGVEVKAGSNKINFCEYFSTNKNHSEIDISNEINSASKCFYGTYITDDMSTMNKMLPEIYKNDYFKSFTKIKNEMTINNATSVDTVDDDVTILKDYKSVKVDNRDIYLNKKDIFLDNAYYKDIEIGTGQISASLYDKKIDYSNNTVILKMSGKKVDSDDDDHCIQKYSSGITISSDNFGVKKYSAPINDDTQNLYISKYDAPVSIQDEYICATKWSKPSFFIYDNTWVNKNIHPSMINDMYVNVQKYMHKSMIDDEYVSVNKNMHHTDIDDFKTWINKNVHHSMVDDNFIGVSKTFHNTHIDDKDIGINKSPKGILDLDDLLLVDKLSKAIDKYNDEKWIYKKPVGIQDINTTFGINKFPKPIGINDNDMQVKYGGKGIVESGDNISINKFSNPITEEQNIYVDVFSKPIHDIDNLTVSNNQQAFDISDFITMDEKLQKAWIYDYSKLFKSKTDDAMIYEHINFDTVTPFGMPDEEGTFVGKKIKDTNLFLTGEFVTAMHYDENEKPSLDDSGNIDELLIPHKDYKYSDFIKKLINEDGTVNFKYVKEYDAKTGEYTVSIPVENPIEIYANIGRDYLDLDVSTLELVVYIVKNIWKDNMFRYTSMSAQDSLKDMLVKLDHTLNNQYDLNKKKKDEAKRCIQLFRWYSEMAILNNCDYVLKFDTKKVAVDYYNKDLGELVNNIEFTNMHISDEYIIEPIVAKGRASITFKNNAIVPGPPLKLSFKLYNINTSSSISIIEDGQTKVLTYKEGIHDLSFDLKEKIILNFTPLNQNQSINVANLFIDNISMRGFTVTYKGRFGEINSVMQEMLDNILVIGDVPESIKEKLKDVAPVTAAVDRLLQYFELHHKEKLKGKRLITKK